MVNKVNGKHRSKLNILASQISKLGGGQRAESHFNDAKVLSILFKFIELDLKLWILNYAYIFSD